MKNFILKLLNNVDDETYKYSEEEMINGKEMAILCYICPVIPYFFNKKNNFVKYHSVIGMNLFVIVLFYYIFFKMIINIDLLIIKLLLPIIWLILLLLSCTGISNVCNLKAKELPFINKIKVFK